MPLADHLGGEALAHRARCHLHYQKSRLEEARAVRAVRHHSELRLIDTGCLLHMTKIYIGLLQRLQSDIVGRVPLIPGLGVGRRTMFSGGIAI